ncbi:hypothetical protein [Streptomyces monomycini]|uniref:hypothetical protein n=1 Tax=Streptomyces monomycini TaxID=371720 RepID=UPI0012FF1FF7|nr:hypothetical protein [Streptomyces monomycini]
MPGEAEETLSGGRVAHAMHAVDWLHAQAKRLKLRPGHPAEMFIGALGSADVRREFADRLAGDCTGYSIAVTANGVRTTLAIGCTVEAATASAPGALVVTLVREAV